MNDTIEVLGFRVYRLRKPLGRRLARLIPGLVLALRQLAEPVGLGTVANAIVVGLSVDGALWLIPDLESIWIRGAALALAPPLLGLASGLYIGAGLGPGPRDGLMTALGRRGMSIARARLIIEVTALAVGWLLGGVVGIGTVYFGLTVGWFVRLFIHRFPVADAGLGWPDVGPLSA